MDSIATRNYATDEGNTWVVGGKLVIKEGAEVEGLPGGEGAYTLPNATATRLGGVKVGSGLNVTDGKISVAGATADKLGGVKLAQNQADTKATDVAGLVTAFNDLLAKLKAAGIMAADT